MKRCGMKRKKMVQELRQDAPDMAEDIVLHDGTEACEVGFTFSSSI